MTEPAQTGLGGPPTGSGAPPRPRDPGKNGPPEKKGKPEKYYRPSPKAWGDSRNSEAFEHLNRMLQKKLEVHDGKPIEKDPVPARLPWRPSREAWEKAGNEPAFEYLNEMLKDQLEPEE